MRHISMTYREKIHGFNVRYTVHGPEPDVGINGCYSEILSIDGDPTDEQVEEIALYIDNEHNLEV